jgi:hypothetical protein
MTAPVVGFLQGTSGSVLVKYPWILVNMVRYLCDECTCGVVGASVGQVVKLVGEDGVGLVQGTAASDIHIMIGVSNGHRSHPHHLRP